jgi:hypothetical protein
MGTAIEPFIETQRDKGGKDHKVILKLFVIFAPFVSLR